MYPDAKLDEDENKDIFMERAIATGAASASALALALAQAIVNDHRFHLSNLINNFWYFFS